MTNDGKPLIVARDNDVVTMPIDVYAPNAINMYMVPEHELSAYESAASEESSAAGFVLFCAGSALSIGITFVTVTLGDGAKALFGALLLVTFVMGAWFLNRFRVARAARVQVRSRMRTSAVATRISQPLRVLPSKPAP